jgi:hypothetical protein
MKKYLFQLLTVFSVALFALFCSCSGMYDNVDKYVGEKVYPARFDTIGGKIGYERVEIDLISAGRIPASQIVMGKSTKTLIEFNNANHRDTAIIIDSLCSWVNITDLTTSKMYRFYIYTLDRYGNRSVPQEIALIPYTAADKAVFSLKSPNITLTPSSVAIDWTGNLSSVQGDYVDLAYHYTDAQGNERRGVSAGTPHIFAANLPIGENYNVNVDIRIIPKIEGKRIIDTVTVSTTIDFELPGASTPFMPKEKAILEQNGVTNFTAGGVASMSKLYFPVHVRTLEDVLYFAGLREVDLTGGSVATLPVLDYNGHGYSASIGGGEWCPFMRRVDNNVAGVQYLLDLLDAGAITKVRYAPNTMGLDDVLAPYITTGVVELVDMPNEALLPYRFIGDGRVHDPGWWVDVTPDPNDAPAGAGLSDIYKVQCRDIFSSLTIMLPKEYRWNFSEGYRYLKFKVCTPSAEKLGDSYWMFKYMLPLLMNCLPSFPQNSIHNFGGGDAVKLWIMDSIEIRPAGQWVDVTLDIGAHDDATYHRVVVLNMGGAGWVANPIPFPSPDIIWYFSNIRLSKTQ